MSFVIERSHVIFKHLIHVGPEINVEPIAEMAVKRDYSKGTRQLQTPRGPLKEYLFRSKTNPNSLIVFSSKGFVIDTQPVESALPMFRDAYDFYEKSLGDRAMTATVVLEINAKFEIYSPAKVDEFVAKLYNENAQKISWKDKKLQTHGIILSTGSKKFPEESIQINIQPLPKDPKKRLIAMTLYRSTELDEALKFIEEIESEIIITLEKIANI